MGWKQKVWAFLKDDPIYVESRSGMTDAGLADGWKVAYEMERDKKDVLQRKLNLIERLGKGIEENGPNAQDGSDILTIINMTKQELDFFYQDGK